MNQIEEITYRYLSSCLGDLSEATEDDVIDAIARINLITRALNERVNMRDVVQQELDRTSRREAGRVAKGNETIQDFLQNPGQYATPGSQQYVDYESLRAGQHTIDTFLNKLNSRGEARREVQRQLSKVTGPRPEFEEDQFKGTWKPDPNARLRTPYELTHATPEQRAASKRQTELEARHDELNRKDIKTLTGFDIMDPEDDENYADEYIRKLSDRIRRRDFASGGTKDYESEGRPVNPDDPSGLRVSYPEDAPSDHYGLSKGEVKAIRDRELILRDATRTQVNAVVAKEKQKSDKLAAEIKAGRGTAAGERRINDLLSKPANSARAEAARQSALASRESVRQSDRESGNVTAISDPDRFEFYSSNNRDVTPTGKVGGGDAAFSFDDITKYHTKQRIKELTGGRSATKSGSDLYVEQYTGSSSGPTGRVNVINVGAERETGRRMANAGYPGSSVGPPRRPASQERLDAMDARMANADDYREFINTDPEFNASNAMWEIENDSELTARRERLTQNLDAASRARDEYAASERGQSEINSRVEAENASRAQRGLPPLNASAERSFRRSAAASGGRMDQYRAARDERMGLPPVETQQPQTTGQPQRAPWQDEGGNFVNPASGSSFSTGRPGSDITGPGGAGTDYNRDFGGQVTGNTTTVASALNSRGFRPANPIINRLRPGGMIA